MPKISDIRKGDIVSLGELSGKDMDKLRKFVKTTAKALKEDVENVSFYVEDYLLEQPTPIKTPIKVKRVAQTEKTKTEYAILELQDEEIGGVEFPVQTRYLNLEKRVSAHPATSIFM